MRISVLILKKDKLIAGMISEWLTEKEFEVIGITDKPNEAIRISRLRQPDIAIIDKVLIEGEGLEIARIIKKESPKSHCIICATENDHLRILEEKTVNISAYIGYNHNLNELLKCIKQITEGYNYISLEFIKSQLSARPHYDEENLRFLSQREKKILMLIGDGLSNRVISENLCISINTLNNHKANIKRKLNIKHSNELLLSLKSLIADINK